MRALAASWRRLVLLAVLGLFAFAFAHQAKAQDEVVRIGDILNIALPGEPALNKDFLVDRQGRVTMPEVGEVQVAGRTLTEATRLIREQLARAYREVQRARVTIKEHRLIMSVVGYVKNPSEVNLAANAGVQEAITAAGGFT